MQHCLIPHPKHVLIQRDEEGNLETSVFAEQQTAGEFLSILGYESKDKTDELVEADDVSVSSNN